MNTICLLEPNDNSISNYRIVYLDDNIKDYDFDNITTIIAPRNNKLNKYITDNFDISTRKKLKNSFTKFVLNKKTKKVNLVNKLTEESISFDITDELFDMIDYFKCLKVYSNEDKYTVIIEDSMYLDTVSLLHEFINGRKTNYLGIPHNKNIKKLNLLIHEKTIFELLKLYSLDELMLVEDLNFMCKLFPSLIISYGDYLNEERDGYSYIFNLFCPKQLRTNLKLADYEMITKWSLMGGNISSLHFKKDNIIVKKFDELGCSMVYILLNHLIIIEYPSIVIYKLEEKNVIKKFESKEEFINVGIVDFGKFCIIYGFDIYILLDESNVYSNDIIRSELLITNQSVIEEYGKKIKFYSEK